LFAKIVPPLALKASKRTKHVSINTLISILIKLSKPNSPYNKENLGFSQDTTQYINVHCCFEE
jgi:hypothetical protein